MLLDCNPIRVLLVDDSSVVRTILQRVLSQFEDIAVVGGAPHPPAARELIIQHRPHVIILDIDMPRMDGITFLKKLTEHYPVPVIMCTGITTRGGEKALEALRVGAIDVVIKPASGSRREMEQLARDLAEKIRVAAHACPVPPIIPSSVTASPDSFRSRGVDPARTLVAIGASTGGTQALAAFLRRTPNDFPPVAIVQHMPPVFTRTFADGLDRQSRMSVSEARDGDVLEVGRAFVAPGGFQLHVQARGNPWRLRLGSTETVNRHCPSVDVFFDSVAEQLGAAAVGVILTGMGGDGAQGLLHMRERGARTFGQNRRSCVVYGMPKVAAEIGAVEQTGAPSDLPELIRRTLSAAQPNVATSRPT